MKKQKKWLKFRHRVSRFFILPFLRLYCMFTYRIRIEKFTKQEKRPYLILFNHQTAFDQFFIEFAVKGPIYYVASEDLFSKGFVSWLISYLVAPIPIKKQTTDVRAVMTCLRVAREGGTVALAPEGNRTFHGRPVYIKPAIAGLARKLGMPVLLFRIEGGFGVHPQWADKIRKGGMKAYVSEVISPEEIATMSDAQLLERIQTGLYVDEACVGGNYVHKNAAEYLERVVYVCPECGFSTFRSAGDRVACCKCGKGMTYNADKSMTGDFAFGTLADWYDWQERFVCNYDPAAYLDTPVYEDRASLSEVILYKKKLVLQKDATLRLYGDRLEIPEASVTICFDDATVVTVVGRNKVNLYSGGKVYQLKGDKHFNGVKYMNLFYRYKMMKEGNEHDEFLGL